MHDPGKALHRQQLRHPPGAGQRDAGDVVAGEIDQHHVFGQFLAVEPHLGLHPVVGIGAGAARTGAGDRLDLDDRGRSDRRDRADAGFGTGAEQGPVAVGKIEAIAGGLGLAQAGISGKGVGAGAGEGAAGTI